VDEALIDRLITTASDKVHDAQSVARQVPDKLGDVTRAEIEGALSLTEDALKADVPELRGNLATAHAAVRRCRF